MMDEQSLEWYIQMLHRFSKETHEPNFVDIIAACRGWEPLVEDEKMIVHYGKKVYIIHRLEDEER